ncbi:MAG: AAA family ATPase [Rhodocyclaceae bacterium]|nr:AAA family ATPase [Rhodocyclaceae bacterium]
MEALKRALYAHIDLSDTRSIVVLATLVWLFKTGVGLVVLVPLVAVDSVLLNLLGQLLALASAAVLLKLAIETASYVVQDVRGGWLRENLPFRIGALLVWLPLVDLPLGLWLYRSYGINMWVHGHMVDLARGLGATLPTHTNPEWSLFVMHKAVFVLEGLASWVPLSSLGSALAAVGVFRFAVLNAMSAQARPSTTTPAADTQTHHPAQQRQQEELQFVARKPKHSFDQVVGMGELKQRLLRAERDFTLGGGNGILLTGEPGNGKTYMAEALAGSLRMRFLSVSAGNLMSMWAGEGSERTAKLFRDARAQAPVVLFIDEIDTFLTDRASMARDGSSAGRDQLATANTFLTELAELNRGYPQHRVLLVAASNFRDELDQAGVREGRFDVKVEVPPPDLPAPLHLLLHPLDEQQRRRADMEQVHRAVKRWEGWSVARIREIAKRTAKAMTEDPQVKLNAALLRKVIDEMLQGAGVRLAEDTLGLDQLYFPAELHKRLQALVQMLQDPDRIESAGATVPRGAVFYGPPGTGKTAAAQAIAKAAGLRLLIASGPDMMGNPKEIDKLINKARDIRPCIVFLDEADGLLGDRRTNPYAKEATNKFLAVIDGPRKLHDVFIIAATNHPDMLDAAVVREGRLSMHLDFTPDKESLLKAAVSFMQSRAGVVWTGDLEAFLERCNLRAPAQVRGALEDALRQAALGQQPGQTLQINLDELQWEASGVAKKRASASNDAAHRSDAIMYDAKTPRHTLDAVVGMESMKQQLLRAEQSFAQEGGNGILLTGEPGNGKTYMAEALAGSLRMRFLSVSAGNLMSMWAGEGSERAAKLFRDARAQAPVLLFIDEIDTFLTDRASMARDGSSAGRDQLATANTFLTELAELNRGYPQHRVLLVAASNFRDELDQAGVREGRFDVKVEVPPPDLPARLHLLLHPLDEQQRRRADMEQVHRAVKRWEGWSVARIREIAKRTAKAMTEDPQVKLSAALLRKVIDEMLQGAGVRLAEDTLGLDQLYFPAELHKRLQALVQMLQDPDRIESAGATVPRGAVFYGPPGTGKTAAAQAIAKAAGLRLLIASVPDMMGNPKEIDKLINKARDIRPCIVFLDEADGLLGDRRTNPYAKEATNKFLAVIDGPRKLHDVFIIAATNHPDMLDAAVVREGRLSMHLDFTPDKESLLKAAVSFMQSRAGVVWTGDLEAFLERCNLRAPAQVRGALEDALRQAALGQQPGQTLQINLDEQTPSFSSRL